MEISTQLYDRRGHRKYLNAEERLRFHRAANATASPNRRAFCLTLFYTGCRISEALNLTIGSIDASEGCLVFRTLKQRRKDRFRTVPAPPELFGLLSSVVGSRDQGARVWGFCRTTAWAIIGDCMTRAQIDGPRAVPKGLRHGFAVACVTNNVPITTVQKWMGHADLKNTSIYLDLTREDEKEFARRTWIK